MKNKKGQLGALVTIGTASIITLLVVILLIVAFIFYGIGFLLNFVKSNILLIIGGFLLIIAGILTIQTKKLNKVQITLGIFGLILIFLNLSLNKFNLLTIMGGN